MGMIITTEHKENLIERIIENASVIFDVAGNSAKVLAECIRAQNFFNSQYQLSRQIRKD